MTLSRSFSISDFKSSTSPEALEGWGTALELSEKRGIDLVEEAEAEVVPGSDEAEEGVTFPLAAGKNLLFLLFVKEVNLDMEEVEG